MAYINFIIIVTYLICIHGICSTRGTLQPRKHWFAMNDSVTEGCQFPTTSENFIFKDCYVRVSTFSHFACKDVTTFTLTDIAGDTFAKCSNISRISPPNMLSRSTSYNASDSKYCYHKLANTNSYNAILYAKLKTYEHCQYYCNSIFTCKVINFNRTSKDCYLGFNTSILLTFASDGIDHYNRYTCVTCKDTFTIKKQQKSFGGRYVASAHNVELCTQVCLSFDNPLSSDFCLGFDYEDSILDIKPRPVCNIYNNNMTLFEYILDDTPITVNHFTRHTCIPSGIYKYTICKYIYISTYIYIYIYI